MNKLQTIEEIDDIVGDIDYIEERISIIGFESNYVFQSKFIQFVIELNKIKTNLIDINDKIGD